MHYMVVADTDVGIVKDTNQDSILVKQARYKEKEIVMAIICDGMGGLSKGELASATVIRALAQWFDNELPKEIDSLNMDVIGGKWSLLLKNLNNKIIQYGQRTDVSLGTTFTGMLFCDDQYLICHVGDTRAYYIGQALQQLTTDQTFIAREIAKGTMTVEQAKTDKRRNLLLQCIGASDKVEPQIIKGRIAEGVYMLCSDGFRHEITSEEIYTHFKPSKLKNKESMHANARTLIDENKKRQEKDNISVVLIKVYQEDWQ